MERFGCVAALPTFLADSEIGSGAFSAKGRLRGGGVRERQLRYLASHRYDVEFGVQNYTAPSGAQRVVLEVALALLERGIWTLPSWNVEQAIAERARAHLGWDVVPVLAPESGDLRLCIRSSLAAEDYRDIFVPSPSEEGSERDAAIRALRDLVDPASFEEERFVVEVASVLPIGLLCMLQPQRDLPSMGIDPHAFFDQRVDFAFETPQGRKLIVEVDGGQHVHDLTQASADKSRDEALAKLGWTTWRIPTKAFSDVEALRVELQRRLEVDKWSVGGGRPRSGASAIFWSATAIARVQVLVLEALLIGAVSLDAPIGVAVLERHTGSLGLAIDDLMGLLERLCILYDAPLPDIRPESSEHCNLLIDVDILNALRPPPRSDAAVAWSRPAMRAATPIGRRIEIELGDPRFLPRPPDQQVLDDLIRDFFRKDGFRRDARNGHSDQAEIAARIMQGKSVVGLLPTGAGKSLPYMLAGLLLPGMTLYVGPLISLLQDQADRLREAGIGHVEYMSSAEGRTARESTLGRVAGQGVRFLLVSPERFLTAGFLDSLKKRELWRGAITQVVIDECHCVSEWGHEFRPAYLSLSRIAKDRSHRFGVHAPLVALTGTASTVVLSDVLRELGIDDADACVRATNLDRPELRMRSTLLPVASGREALIVESARTFLRENAGPLEGLLVFCPFKGGQSMGVFSVAAELTRKLPGTDVRFYCGGEFPWADYAVYAKKRKKSSLTGEVINSVVPSWAQGASGLRPWAEVKEAVRRDFVGGTKTNFRVLVATKAFGMGIDKSSIRKVIHAVAPTSPEAFYQEIGRAGRDGKLSEAELVFCDAEPAATDRILDPSLSHEEATATYRDFIKDNKYGGGDFLRTFHFHSESFRGIGPAVDATNLVAQHIHAALDGRKDLSVPFDLDLRYPDEKDIEYGIVRLMHLGVITGYLKDYNRKFFSIELSSDWLLVRGSNEDLAGYLAENLSIFIRRYRLVGGSEEVERVRGQDGSLQDLYDVAARQMMSFIYSQLERQRRVATRAMLEISRVGLSSSDQMRHRLLNYLQVSVRFTALLEKMAAEADPASWIEMLEDAVSPQDLAELHGAAQRILASFPIHPGLLFVSAISRPMQTEDDPLRSDEEMRACLRQAEDNAMDLKAVLGAFTWFEGVNFLQKNALRDPVASICGALHLAIASDAMDLAPYLVADEVRDVYVARLLRRAEAAARLN